MPPRNAFKTNASFFRMLALGAVGAQTVQQHLEELGHSVVELERGALSTKIWRDVKRKRVRIPDLCCTACGVRIESRAKTSPDLRMSHSTGDAERAWDYGMLDSDWIAFPVLSPEQNIWSAGALDSRRSLWRERILTSWKPAGHINMFSVSEFRAAPFTQLHQKGVTEGSELQVKWSARFAPEDGRITAVQAGRVHYTATDAPDRRRYYQLGADQHAFLQVGEAFRKHQVIAGHVAPLSPDQRRCRQGCDHQRIEQMLGSRERTDPGDIVLDIFAGSNTTGRAAEDLHRRWIAMELDEDYAAGSALRFMEHLEPTDVPDVFDRLCRPRRRRPTDLSGPPSLLEDTAPQPAGAP